MPALGAGPCTLALAGIAAAALGGCANGRVSDQDTARGTVETFLAQCAAGRGERVFETLNGPARSVLLEAGGTRRGCNDVLRPTGGPLSTDELRAATPKLTRFDGAVAEFDVERGGKAAAHVVVRHGSEGWLIEGPS